MAEALVLQCQQIQQYSYLAECKFSTVERKNREGDCKGGQFWACTPYIFTTQVHVLYCDVGLHLCIDTACCIQDLTRRIGMV